MILSYQKRARLVVWSEVSGVNNNNNSHCICRQYGAVTP